LSNDKFIIPEYKINLINKSKKIIMSVENINALQVNKNKSSKIEKKKNEKNSINKKKGKDKSAIKNKDKTKKTKTKKKIRTLWIRKKKLN